MVRARGLVRSAVRLLTRRVLHLKAGPSGGVISPYDPPPGSRMAVLSPGGVELPRAAEGRLSPEVIRRINQVRPEGNTKSTRQRREGRTL